MKLAILQYNAGNIRSVSFALERLGVEPLLSEDPEVLRSADKIIFPGVGEASSAMAYLRARRLDALICELRQPLLGICLGLQLMCRHSEENDTPCLGIFPAQVRRFPDAGLKVPHMGWNTLDDCRGPLLEGLGEQPWAYFVHSYYAEPIAETQARTHYGLPFSAVIQRDNFYATQFHPEKSGETGAKILENFLRI
jgi:glutamine amidotransferase